MDEMEPYKVGGLFSKMEKIADLVWKFKDELNAACTDLQPGAPGDQGEKKHFWWNMGVTVQQMATAWKLFRFDAPTRASKETMDAAMAVNVRRPVAGHQMSVATDLAAAGQQFHDVVIKFQKDVGYHLRDINGVKVTQEQKREQIKGSKDVVGQILKQKKSSFCIVDMGDVSDVSDDDSDASSESSATTVNGISGHTLTNGTETKVTRLRSILMQRRWGAYNKPATRRVTYADMAQTPVKKDAPRITT